MNYRGIQLKINLRNYWTVISIICLLVAFLGLHVNAYDREAAVSYAHNWWNTDIDGDGVHNDYNPAYNYYPYNPVTHSGGDCTNFVSQCLRYGGIRFSSDDGYVDNKGCLIRATELPPALLSSSHGGKTSGTLKIGDVASLSVPTKQYVHSIMIVVTAPGEKVTGTFLLHPPHPNPLPIRERVFIDAELLLRYSLTQTEVCYSFKLDKRGINI